MDKFAIAFAIVCCLSLVAATDDLSIHDYDIQIHPIHSHHGYEHDGFATSVRYDKRYHHKIPVAPVHPIQHIVYQYVADEGQHDQGQYDQGQHDQGQYDQGQHDQGLNTGY